MCTTICHHRLKLYMPDKLHPYGFKFLVQSGISGFAYDYEIYSGAIDMTNKENQVRGKKDLGNSGNVVVRLSRNIPKNQNYCLYFDNYYTSIPLIIFLKKLGIYSIGTVRKNRIINCKISKDWKKKRRGSIAQYLALLPGCTLYNVSWIDNKDVTL